MEKLTKGQKEALEAVRTGRNVCITGGGGVGKSYISRKIIEDLQKQRKTVLITASTGRAAMLIGGITCHRAFNIPVKLTWQAEPKITASSPIYEADAVIIDEVSMLRIDAFEFIARVVKDVNEIRKSPEYRKDPKNRHRDPVQMIVVGDFGQLPPVIVHPNDGSPDEGDLMSECYGFDVGSGYAFQASGWKQSDFLLCDLQEVVRQSDQAMVDALQRIRFGDYTAIEYFSKNARKKPFSSEEGVVYLCGKNRTAERINDVRVSKLSGKERTYEAEITGQVTEQDKQAPELLRLKKNAQVVMLLNTEKYRNGSTAIVKQLRSREITVKIEETGELVDVPYASWNVERYVVSKEKKKVEREVIGTYRQLPVRLGYAVTIHKAQGQSLDKVVLVLESDDQIEDAEPTRPEIFAYGQLYVGLSRATTMDGLYIEGNLDLVDKLAAPEILEFYGVPEPAATSEPKKVPLQKLPESEKKAKKGPKEPKKTEKDSGMVEVQCKKHAQRVAWTFAHTLAPKAEIQGNKLIIPAKCREQVESFIKAIGG